MLDTPQKIDLTFAGRRHWFYVYRYTTDQEFIDAMHKDEITDQNAYKKDTIAYTDCYQGGDECGRMYLLDKSINTMAHEATHMALGILSRGGHTDMPIVDATDTAPEIEEMLCQLIGSITSDLYSQSKHF